MSDAGALLARNGRPKGFPPLKALYRHRDFEAFLKHFGALAGLLRHPDDPAWLLRRLASRLRRQNVLYAEVRVSPAVWKRHGLAPEPAFGRLVETAEKVTPRLRIIVDGVRQWERRGLERDLDLCRSYRDRGVVALGLGGDEAAAPAGRFRWLAARCRRFGIPVIPHAGEALGPEEVSSALDVFAPPRIGHGVAAARDERFMGRLRRSSVHLEVCPTSNRRTGVIEPRAPHPLGRLLENRVSCSLGTDDPALFRRTLTGELSVTGRRLGLTMKDLLHLQVEAARNALLPPEPAKALERSLIAGWGEEIRRRGAGRVARDAASSP